MMIRSVLAAFLYLCVVVSGASAQCISFTPLTNGTTASASDVMTNFGNIAKCVRDTLTAARTYYVRTDGSDSNTGLVDSPSGAFLTIAKAMSVAGSVDCAAQQLTIQIDAGTWTTPVVLPRVLASLAPILQGVGSTTIISTSATAITANGATPWTINNLKLVTTGTGIGVFTQNGSVVTLSGIEWGAIGTYGMLAASLSAINVTGNNTISGNAQYWAIANNSSIAFLGGTVVTLTGTPAFSGAFVLANRLVLFSHPTPFPEAPRPERFATPWR